MKRTDFTQHMIMALATAVIDRNHDDVRVLVETLAKEHNVPMPADWNVGRLVGQS
jgi:hypothetical protein